MDEIILFRPWTKFGELRTGTKFSELWTMTESRRSPAYATGASAGGGVNSRQTRRFFPPRHGRLQALIRPALELVRPAALIPSAVGRVVCAAAPSAGKRRRRQDHTGGKPARPWAC